MIETSKILTGEFYCRDTAKVARELLGKKLIRKTECSGNVLGGIIIETEAYYGETDPASRAYHGEKNYNKVMWSEPGQLFIYNVHQYWMLNIVAHKEGAVGAVLIRAIEPSEGINLMMRNRPVDDIHNLTSGPGKLTLALNINKKFNGRKITDTSASINIYDNKLDFESGSSNRIGVTKDLKEKLRFYIVGNAFLSD